MFNNSNKNPNLPSDLIHGALNKAGTITLLGLVKQGIVHAYNQDFIIAACEFYCSYAVSGFRTSENLKFKSLRFRLNNFDEYCGREKMVFCSKKTLDCGLHLSLHKVSGQKDLSENIYQAVAIFAEETAENGKCQFNKTENVSLLAEIDNAVKGVLKKQGAKKLSFYRKSDPVCYFKITATDDDYVEMKRYLKLMQKIEKVRGYIAARQYIGAGRSKK